jgi:CheY-specific phosphatase CheX
MMELALQPATSEMMKHLDSAVAEVFELMLGVACRPVESSIEFSTSLAVTICLSGQLEGTCLLRLSHTAARSAMEVMLGGSDGGSEAMLEDTARELCNMIVGSWKSRLPPVQASALLSLPVVSRGQNVEDLLLGRRRLYRFDGNLLAMVLSMRDDPQNYLTTDWKSGELSSDAN